MFVSHALVGKIAQDHVITDAAGPTPSIDEVVNASTPRRPAMAASSRMRRLLPMARRPHHADHRTVAVECAVQQALDGGHLPPPSHQIRLSTPDRASPSPPTTPLQMGAHRTHCELIAVQANHPARELLSVLSRTRAAPGDVATGMQLSDS